MKIHEYQAKELLASFSVPVERGVVVRSAEEIGGAMGKLGERARYAVKAQIHSGGRGKGHFSGGLEGGGVQLVSSEKKAVDLARRMLGNRLVTAQNGPDGSLVTAVYIAEVLEPQRQFYLSILIDRAAQRPVVLASRDGGVEIEALAEEHPEKILREHIHPLFGPEAFQARRIAFWLGLKDDVLWEDFQRTLAGIYRIFWEKNASLVEINPLIVTEEGRLCALDAKINFEDNGLPRHEDIRALRDSAQEDEKEVRASEFGLSYIALDGTVGCLTNGAGLAMATMDMLHSYGIRPANFLDLGDNSGVDAIAEAVRILLSDKNARCLLVNIFGGAMRGDLVADGILKALDGKGLSLPLVVRIEGANAELGRKTIAAALPGTVFADDLAAIGYAIKNAYERT
ncbi:MAG: ADP-forming succinate--CoA ligase subunit beta [Puniceicoccales bacterium]|jgi:succinyl-CoA synthetase beta subunit|nr:ADP-forming succinate--CoA ligase subunit beta [Puniceicoccales bacterium]